MKKIYNALIVLIAAFILTSFVYITKFGGQHYIKITDAIAVLSSASAIFFGAMAIHRYKISSMHGTSLFLILLGIGCWFLSDFIFFIFYVDAYVISETLRLLAYIPLTAAFFYIITVSKPKFWEHKKYLIRLLVVFLLFGILYLLILPMWMGGISIVHAITTYGYIVTDFTLLFGIAILIKVSYTYRGGYLSKVWMIIGVAFISLFLFDLYFAIYRQTFQMGNFVEVLVLANYWFIALGFYYNSYILDKLRETLEVKKLDKV